MERFAILVDAGYLFAAASKAVTGSRVPREGISIRSIPALVQELIEVAAKSCQGLQLLRIYWYDALHGPRMSLEQSELARYAGVKLRLGSLNTAGEQKGVDSLIVTDLIELARNRALADAVLVSGDEDLRVAVQVAQTFGVRVHILAVGTPSTNVSLGLQMEADSVSNLDKDWLDKLLKIKPVSPLVAESVTGLGPTDAGFDAVAQAVAESLLSPLNVDERTALQSHFAGGDRTVPPEFDGKLIAMTAARLGRMLQPAELRRARGIFVTVLRKAAD